MAEGLGTGVLGLGVGVQCLQGYLAHKKHPPHRTLQQPFAKGPIMILGGSAFLMDEVSLKCLRFISNRIPAEPLRVYDSRIHVQGLGVGGWGWGERGLGYGWRAGLRTLGVRVLGVTG